MTYLTNVVETQGGKAFERDIAYKTVHWCIQKLLPRYRTLDITVTFKDLKGVYGYCMEGDNNRTFELEIAKGLGLFDMISTICHEMVHVKQYAKREMDGYGERWKKSKIKDGTPYMELPWEKEAFRLERGLAIECFEAI